MKFEDNTTAFYVDPNAYIQNYSKKEKEQTRKIVFAEPYESVPNFYINNNFKKRDCDCVPKGKNDKCCDCNCSRDNNVNHECNCNQQNKGNNSFLGSFNLQSLLPMLSMFNKNESGGLNNIMSIFNKNDTIGSGSNIVANLLSQPEMITNITKLFTGGGLNFLKNKQPNKEVTTTDYEIKNYTRVD